MSVAWLDYGWVLPVLARLPRWLAWPLVVLRGGVNFVFDWDWRTLALGHGYVRGATLDAMRALAALAGSGQSPVWLTLKRYVCASREEVDCWRLHRLDYARVPHSIEGLEGLLQARARGQGVVLLTAHFDSLYVGLALLARAGARIHLMATRLTSDPQVPPTITQHFDHKIGTLDKLLAPARVARFEDGLRFFVRALQGGDAVMMACDGVGTSTDRPQPVRFLGAQRLMASGPEFLAAKAGALVALFSCYQDSRGVWRISVSDPVALEDGGMQRAYALLEEQLLAAPWRWWAADQMRNYVSAH
jgi:hypothetical protein